MDACAGANGAMHAANLLVPLTYAVNNCNTRYEQLR
jgi:hypothetical protein